MAINFLEKPTKLTNLIFLSIIIIVNYLLKIPITSYGFFALTYDQGRDLLQVAKIIYDGNYTLIGPTTGLQGIFYGPYWYYFLSAIFFISRGDPQTVGTVFSLFGLLTVVALYFYLKSTLNSILIAFLLTLIASLSTMWMFGPTIIWNTSLVPILIISFFYVLNRILKSPSGLNFFLLGIVSFIQIDFEFPWGSIMILFTLSLPLLFRKNFLKKQYVFTLLGFLLVISPRILFNIRNGFLELKSFAAYLHEPKIYGTVMPFWQRVVQRLDVYLGNFSESFSRGNKPLGSIILLLLVLVVFLLIKYDKNSWKKLKSDFIFRCGITLIAFSFIFFSIFKDTVWDYYLIGFPITALIVISRVFNFSNNSKKYPKIACWLTIFALLVININLQLLHPFRITWLGDGATYRNQKAVMDYIAQEKPHNYTIYAYSPAIFDYPFDYLISWYTKNGKIEKPQSYSKLFYMVIREANSDRYLKTGWYGDKTRDKTKVLERKYFTGDLLLEKHERNEN
jgi:hypothetical protein